jgi:hypothetical protein
MRTAVSVMPTVPAHPEQHRERTEEDDRERRERDDVRANPRGCEPPDRENAHEDHADLPHDFWSAHTFRKNSNGSHSAALIGTRTLRPN